MRQFRQLSQMLDSMPVWAQFLIALVLILYSCISVYGRINLEFGVKVFSHVSKDQIRDNKGHVIQYTIIPVLVTVGYVALLIMNHATGTDMD